MVLGTAYRFAVASLFALALVSCGSSSSSATGDGSTHTLSFTVTEGTLAQIVKGAGLAKAVDPTGWSVSCVSTDTSGVKTEKTGSYCPVAQKISVAAVPDNQDTVCHLMQGSTMLSTLQFSDTDALGNLRDTSKVTADTDLTIAYTAALGKAVVSTSSGVESAAAEDRFNMGTKWSINCQDVRNILTNEADSSKACPSVLSNTSNYLHLVMAEDSSGTLKTGYGAWSSYEAYAKCGSTEGLDDLPAGWTLDSVNSSTQGGAFSWSAPFASFSSNSTSAEILDMIRAANVSGVQTYSDFKIDPLYSEFCAVSEDVCASKYYEEVLRVYGRGSDVCWPDLRFSFSTASVVTAERWPDMGSTTRPLSRYSFMEAFQNGSETYMRSFDTFVKYAANDSGSVQCNVKSEFLVAIDTKSVLGPGGAPPEFTSIITPGGDPGGNLPAEGSTGSMRFISNTLVEAVDGTDASNSLCQSQLGASSERTANGFYSKVEMVAEEIHYQVPE